MTPGCANSTLAVTPGNPRGPWPFPDATNPRNHYPDQSLGGHFNVLHFDGHCGLMNQEIWFNLAKGYIWQLGTACISLIDKDSIDFLPMDTWQKW